MPFILVTNDDGIHSAGLKSLREAIAPLGETFVVAPDRERSAAAHSLTIHRPLKVHKLSEGVFSVTGTPTDCVAVGIGKLTGRRPDMVVSGINPGPNLGDDITYSGTVAAALEGTIIGIPSIAVSVAAENGEDPQFEAASFWAAKMAAYILLESPLPAGTLLNINVPNLPLNEIKGARLTRQGKRLYEGAIQETYSPWGEKYYWIGGGTPQWEHSVGTDITAVKEGYVSVTPLHPDLTNYSAMDVLKEVPGPWNTND